MFRFLALPAAVLALSAGVAGAPAAQTIAGVTPSPTVAPQGTTLSLAGCGSREKLWIDLYAVALYLPRPGLNRQQILAPDTPVAVRVYPTYDGELPEEIPESWRERLKRELSPEDMAVFRKYFARLTTTDIATVAFRPGKGTVLMINDQVFRTVKGAGMMHGILRTWLGPDSPIDLLSGGC